MANKIISDRNPIALIYRTKLILESKPRIDKDEQKLLIDIDKMLNDIFRFVPQEDFLNLEQAQ